ncbi:TPA: hypothetical protein TZ704_001978 [Streptococcus suis]|nr:hypothetical protein [Streptococcus suis]
MTGKRLLSIIVGILVVGGLVMFFSLNGDNQLSKEEQQYQLEVQIAKMLVNDYEDVETIEFHGWGHSRETGMWGTTVVVNGSNRMSFSFSDLKGLENIRGIRYNLDSFTLIEKSETKSKLRIMDRIDEILTVSITGTTVIHSNHRDEE